MEEVNMMKENGSNDKRIFWDTLEIHKNFTLSG